MPEIRFTANAQTIQNIGDYIGDTRGTKVCDASLQFMNWAVNEMNRGREILAVDENGNIHSPVFFFPEVNEGEK